MTPADVNGTLRGEGQPPRPATWLPQGGGIER